MRPIIYFVALPSIALLTVIALSWAYHFGYIRAYRFMVEYIRKYFLQHAQSEFDRRVDNSRVRCLLLDKNGFLLYQKNETEKEHHVFCECKKTFCNKHCQFFDQAISYNDGRATFMCWLNRQYYLANWFHDPSCTTTEGAAQ